MGDEKFIGTAEAAKIMGLHRYTLMEYCRKKKIRFGRVGRRYRFLVKDVQDCVMSNGHGRSH